MACSSQKKATWPVIAYNNVSAHYNVWWNGNESLKEGILKLEKSVKDDYTQILPVYRLGSKEEAMAVYPEMDRAVEKGVKGIKQHSVLANGVEKVHYVRKCYLLTALGTFYKHDYAVASNTAQTISSQYAGTEEADVAAILVARCLTADKQYADAEHALDELVVALGKGNFSRSLQADLFMAMAECTLPQAKYKKAVQFIKMALDQNPKREQKARLNYILGQVYLKLDKRKVASKYFEAALRSSQEYTMEFNARLSIAMSADLQHSNLAKLERSLQRMLRDKKNDEFHDQIFYAQGEMYMGMKDADKACASLSKSVAVSNGNNAQKALSAIRLADINYELYENYDSAFHYYAIAMGIIKPDYPNYRQIKSRHDVLSSLVVFTRQIVRNDSILAVADLSPAERNELIQKTIADLKAAEEAAKEKELLDQLNEETKAMQNTLQGDWYFYNPNTVQQGKQTFSQRWGTRVLEDYWFLSKKGLLGMGSLIAGNDTPDAASDSDDTSDADTSAVDSIPANANANDPHNPAFYLKDLPSSPEQRDSMNLIIASALLNAGYIFYDGVGNTPKALECYLRLANNYPDHPDVVQAFYMLYRIYSKQGNTPSADYYRNMVLMGFPDGDFANLIRDENYYLEIAHRDQVINEEYENLYHDYCSRRFRNVIAESQHLRSTYPNDPMTVKFQYWEALAFARLDSVSRAVALLQSIVDSRPASDSIVPLAQAQINYLGGNPSLSSSSSPSDDDGSFSSADELAAKHRNAVAEDQASSPNEQQLSSEAMMFRYKESMQHYVIILVKDKKIRATDVQYKIADFNAQYYSNAGYKVNALLFTDSIQMLTVHRFNNASDAFNYWTHLQQDDSPLKQYPSSDYFIFAISNQNYSTFYNRKNINAYQEFFDKYYLNK